MKTSRITLLAALALSNCKEERAIGKGFVLNSPIQILKKPDRNSVQVAAAQILSEVEILRLQVPDKKNDKLFWFKVKQNGAVGYVSYDEEILKKNFVSVKPDATGKKALMTTELRIREKPTQKAASVGLLKTGSAFYAPSAAAVDMVEAIMKDQKRVVPCAMLCEGEYGLKDVIVGVPVRLGRGGGESIVEYDLTAEERGALQASSDAVRDLCGVVDRLLTA